MSNQIIVGIDVGTSKVAVAVGEVHSDGSVMITGVGQSPSAGVRKGEIVDVKSAKEAIQAAVEDAETSSGVEIRDVFVSITGTHIRSFTNNGSLPVMGDEGEVTAEDVESVVQIASALSLPIDNVPIHRIKQLFSVDGNVGVENPVGMHASKIEVDVHVIHGMKTRLQNTLTAIRRVPLDIQGVAFSPLASALAVLTSHQKEIGALLVDIGGGTADYAVYSGGTVRHTGVLGVGGDHFTNDLVVGLKIPTNRAENLKIEHGSVSLDESETGQMIPMKSEVGLPDRAIPKDVVCRILQLRMEELLHLVKDDVESKGMLGGLGAGVFLTGGVARTRGLQQLAERVFGLPVIVGATETVSGVQSVLESPEFAAAVGLVRYGSLSEAYKPKRRNIWVRLATAVRI